MFFLRRNSSNDVIIKNKSLENTIRANFIWIEMERPIARVIIADKKQNIYFLIIHVFDIDEYQKLTSMEISKTEIEEVFNKCEVKDFYKSTVDSDEFYTLKKNLNNLSDIGDYFVDASSVSHDPIEYIFYNNKMYSYTSPTFKRVIDKEDELDCYFGATYYSIMPFAIVNIDTWCNYIIVKNYEHTGQIRNAANNSEYGLKK